MEHKIERAVLAGLAADCFKKSEQATEQTLDELEALLETAGGTCAATSFTGASTALLDFYLNGRAAACR